MVQGRFISEADYQTLQRMLRWWRRQENRRANLEPDQELPTAPEVYIAFPPGDTDPLPALDPATGVGTDTKYRPGSADCYIYRILEDDLGPYLQQVGSETITVYNITPFPIIDHEWILVKRDKWGSWIADLGQGAVYTGKTTAAHALNDVQDVDLYEPDYTGTLQSTGITVNARNRMEDIPNADQVVYLRKNPGCYVYDIISANPCPSGTGT